jgi:multidrug transporter EmrE-like cation transporter
MSTTAIFLVLSAAVVHAGWNVFAHAVSRIGLPFLWWGAVLSTVLWAGIVPLTGGLGTDLSSFAFGVGVSAALHVAYLLVLQKGYRVAELSTVYATARGSGPIISVVVAIAVLGERPDPTALVGVALVLAGC